MIAGRALRLLLEVELLVTITAAGYRALPDGHPREARWLRLNHGADRRRQRRERAYWRERDARAVAGAVPAAGEGGSDEGAAG
jgi:hypothetical protein